MHNKSGIIVIVNINGVQGESIKSILTKWGYSVKQLTSSEFNPVGLRLDEVRLVLFQFKNFSDNEFRDLNLWQDNLSKVPIIATAVIMSANDIFRIGKAGITDFILQPVGFHQLDRLVNAYVRIPTDSSFYDEDSVKS